MACFIVEMAVLLRRMRRAHRRGTMRWNMSTAYRGMFAMLSEDGDRKQQTYSKACQKVLHCLSSFSLLILLTRAP